MEGVAWDEPPPPPPPQLKPVKARARKIINNIQLFHFLII
jgi:hypothetical protein